MHRRTLEELDFYRIRETITGFCVSEEGKKLLQRREPFTSEQKEEMDRLKVLGSQWQSVLNSKTPFSLRSWPEIHSFLKVLKAEGSTLQQDQLYAIFEFAESATDVYASVKSASKELSIKSLLDLSEKLPFSQLSQCSQAISRIIDKNGQLKDIPVLREIKARISSIQAEINSALKKYTSDTSLNSVLESNVPAFRADRQVLAVKANEKNRISGIVHEVSNSGRTLFIEPEEVVRKNNELVQEEFRLAQETRKVFTQLTAQIHPFYEDLKSALETMTLFDVTHAAARFGTEIRGIYAADTSDDFAPQLLQARHPLLGDKAVPIDIKFHSGKNILIITGPNTGGKTVTIKTFALLSLLNQAGFPVPAAEGTRLSVFDSIFADIGDEQSIDQSLSTFSAHMKNIAASVKFADSRSLVLLDELGSGTDPQEGGAIAMATLDALIEKKAFVLVTTHHGILKNYGYTNEYCINASADFDTDTLSPTYRILMGVPGESHALDIAKRSGLPGSTVNKAKSYITSQQADVGTLIKGLTQKHAELSKREQEFALTEKKLTDRLLKFEQKELRLRQKENELKEREHREESRFLRETRKTLENLVRELREGEITREKTLKMRKFINDLTEDIDEQEKDIEEEQLQLEKQKNELDKKIEAASQIAENGMKITRLSDTRTSSSKKTKKKLSNKEALATAKATFSDEEVFNLAPPSQKKDSKPVQLEFKEGAQVLAGPSRAKGTLLRQEKKGVWLVQLGSLKMSIKEKDMILINVREPSLSTADYTVELAKNLDGENSIFTKNGPDQAPLFELRLLGLREEEAVKLLQKQLDLCAMQNFKSFSVIHGKGNGILQQAVQDYLSNYPGIKSFYYARPEDGGFGKTYVELL